MVIKSQPSRHGNALINAGVSYRKAHLSSWIVRLWHQIKRVSQRTDAYRCVLRRLNSFSISPKPSDPSEAHGMRHNSVGSERDVHATRKTVSRVRTARTPDRKAAFAFFALSSSRAHSSVRMDVVSLLPWREEVAVDSRDSGWSAPDLDNPKSAALEHLQRMQYIADAHHQVFHLGKGSTISVVGSTLHKTGQKRR